MRRKKMPSRRRPGRPPHFIELPPSGRVVAPSALAIETRGCRIEIHAGCPQGLLAQVLDWAARS